MKPIFLLVFSLIIGNVVFAQKQVAYFIKGYNQLVSTKDSADYIRIVTEPDTGKLFNVKEVYKTGATKLIGRSAKKEGDFFEGQVTGFFPSGQKRYVANYVNGNLGGDFSDYYPDGKPYCVYKIMRHDLQVEDRVSPGISYISVYDKQGKIVVDNGTGHFINYGDDYNTIVDEGDIVHSHKNGEWKGYDKTWGISFTEEYEMGKFVKGSSTDKKGNTYPFKEREESAEFPGGESAFNSFLKTNVIYPKHCKDNNIQGRVIMSIDVAKDGSLSNFQILFSRDAELSAETIRVARLMPKRFSPGKEYGQVADTKFVFPLNFSLSSN